MEAVSLLLEKGASTEVADRVRTRLEDLEAIRQQLISATHFSHIVHLTSLSLLSYFQYGHTALIKATLNDNDLVVTLLLEKGANPEATGNVRQRDAHPLHSSSLG